MNEIEKVQDFLFYNSEDGSVKVQVLVDAETETIWATQKAMAELFGVGIPAISKHLSHIFEEGELEKNMVVSKMEITTRWPTCEAGPAICRRAFAATSRRQS